MKGASVWLTVIGLAAPAVAAAGCLESGEVPQAGVQATDNAVEDAGAGAPDDPDVQTTDAGATNEPTIGVPDAGATNEPTIGVPDAGGTDPDYEVFVPDAGREDCVSDDDCGDSDPCNSDRCDAAAGTCVHTPAPVISECAVDADCDDGNACTVDRCVLSPYEFCVQPGTCVSEPLEDCVAPNPCSGSTAVSAGSVHDGQTGSFLGTAWPEWNAMECYSGEAGGPFSCGTGIALTDASQGGFQVVLPSDASSAATCQANCGPEGARNASVSCDAMQPGVAYVAWGRIADGASSASGTPRQLAADGYCLATTGEALAGTYTATLSVNGGTYPTTLELAYAPDSGRLVPTPNLWDDADFCSAIGLVSAWLVPGDGQVQLHAILASGDAVDAALWSRGNTLEGAFGTAFGSVQLVLNRVAPTPLSWGMPGCPDYP